LQTDLELIMKLRFAPTSPFARKVIVAAMERGLEGQIEKIMTDPFAENPELRKINPLSKIPALELDDGQVIIESALICEYLDGLHDGPKLFPEGNQRFPTLKRMALADGMANAGVLFRIETQRRPAELLWQPFAERQKKAMLGSLSMLEDDADAFSAGDDLTIADIALGCCLGWFDLRFPDLGWRTDNPAIADWFEDFSNRPSMAQTMPS
jgi:glutathione S-transferase